MTEVRRTEHCAFKNLNTNGKCIADCWYNIENLFELDCVGNIGKTKDSEGIHEVPIERRCKLERKYIKR